MQRPLAKISQTIKPEDRAGQTTGVEDIPNASCIVWLFVSTEETKVEGRDRGSCAARFASSWAPTLLL